MITRRNFVIAPAAGAPATPLFSQAIRLFAMVCAASLLAQDAGAQNYPTHSIRCIIPYTPGGPPDVVARIIIPKTLRAARPIRGHR